MATMTEAPAATLTYEAYMAEPEVQGRYDIVNGVRIIMPGATWDHQTIVLNLADMLRQYARTTGAGKTNVAPFDVLIRRTPKLQTRQPDVLFVSSARLAQVGGRPVKGPLEAAPELVIEIISDSETQRILEDKIADYISIGVDECWVVRPDAGTVEVLALTPDGARSVAMVGEGQAVASGVFAGLAVAVADVFAP